MLRILYCDDRNKLKVDAVRSCLSSIYNQSEIIITDRFIGKSAD